MERKASRFPDARGQIPEKVTDIALLVPSAGQGAILGAVVQPIH
jgi:hypothetical protein